MLQPYRKCKTRIISRKSNAQIHKEVDALQTIRVGYRIRQTSRCLNRPQEVNRKWYTKATLIWSKICIFFYET